MAGVAEARPRGDRQLTDLGSPGLVRREAAYWRCCGLTLPATSRPSRWIRNTWHSPPVSGSFSATSLNPSSVRPGQKLPVAAVRFAVARFTARMSRLSHSIRVSTVTSFPLRPARIPAPPRGYGLRSSSSRSFTFVDHGRRLAKPAGGRLESAGLGKEPCVAKAKPLSLTCRPKMTCLVQSYIDRCPVYPSFWFTNSKRSVQMKGVQRQLGVQNARQQDVARKHEQRMAEQPA